jgi:hypothetical protein
MSPLAIGLFLFGTWGVAWDASPSDAARFVPARCHTALVPPMKTWTAYARREAENGDRGVAYELVVALNGACGAEIPFWSMVRGHAEPLHKNVRGWYATPAFQKSPATLKCARDPDDPKCVIPRAWEVRGVTRARLCLSPEAYSVVLSLWRWSGGTREVEDAFAGTLAWLSRDARDEMSAPERAAHACEPFAWP